MSGSSFSDLAFPVTERDHAQGPASAPATLVEYGDFQCPYCGESQAVIRQLQAHFGNRLRFVFRHFPLTEIHQNAEHAAEAAEAAGNQGQFWEMHDYLFEHQHELDVESLLSAAAELGLNAAKFKKDLAKQTHAARVREDVLSGTDSGVQGTPTFFLNGRLLDQEDDFETLKRAIDAVILSRSKTK